MIVVGHTTGRRADNLGARVAEVLGGRGGGLGVIYQGKAASLTAREAALRILSEG